jgi:outer membrane protein assembly factor BamB
MQAMNHARSLRSHAPRYLGLILTFALLSLLARSAVAGLAGDAPWPALHRDAARTGRTAVAGPTTNDLRWVFPTGSAISSSPAIAADGTVYFGAWDGKLYAVNKNGFVKWTFTAGGYISSSPAIGADGTVYFGAYDGKVYAVNPDGSLRWSFSTGDIVTSSPMLGSDGTVYVGSWDFNLYAINPDGTQKWAFLTGSYVSSSPALAADGTIYVGSWDNKLYAVNPDGTQKWAFATESAVSGSPAVGPDGTVYVGSWDGKLYAVDPDGNRLWSYTTDGYIRSSPALAADGTVYIGASWDAGWYETVYAVQPPANSNPAQKLWKTNVGSSGNGEGDQIVSLPIVDGNGYVFVGGKNSQVHALDPSDGSVLWSYATGNQVDATPAIGADGTLYIGSFDGKLYAFGTALSACSNKDFDADDRITVADLIHLALRLGKTSADADWNPRYDLEPNDQIDADDLAALAQEWRTSC